MSRTLVLAILTTLAALISAVAQAQVCRVTTAGSDTGDGSDWSTQAMDLHSALGDAGCGEIWVAGGVYKPGAEGDRSASFTIARQLEIYGGFEGAETDPGERGPVTNPTVFSGDIDNNDTINADGVTKTADDIAGANSHHVLWIDGTTTSGSITGTTVLDGFIITAGQAEGGFPGNTGGGLYCNGEGSGQQCSPTLNSITFSGNSAGLGGAMSNQGYANGNSSPVLNNVTFSGNDAFDGGGAMYNNGSGGNSSPALNNVTFNGNSTQNGGGGAMHSDGLFGNSSPALNNVILWGNNAPNNPEIFNIGATSEINDSIVQGGCPANSNCNNFIDEDPLLGPLADNGGFTQTMLPGAAGAAVDAGNNATCLSEDQRGIARPQGGACDIGAVEFAFPTLVVAAGGQGVVDADVSPAPVSGGIAGCNEAGQGQSQCMATYTEGDIVALNLTPDANWHIDSVSGCGGSLSGNTYTTGSMMADCTVQAAFVQEPVDGQCGAADGGVFSQPPGENLCAAGEPSAVLGDGPWTWTCQGITGGEDASCGADYQPPVNEIFIDQFEG